MKDLKQQIEELKTRIAQLEGMVSKPEITKDYGKFVPEIGQLYYYFDDIDNIKMTENDNYAAEIKRFNIHNAFPTEEAAEAEAKYTLISRQYRSFARKLNGDWKPDWKDGNDKWGIVYDEGNLEILSWASLNGSIHQVSFHKKEHAELALKVFGDDLLVLCS
jgi:hypothetical protein